MGNPSLTDEIKLSKIFVHKGRYAYLKAKDQILGDHFLISKDDDEITVVTEEKNINNVPHDDEVKWFKLFEVKANTPFLCVGFIATITKTIANKGLNVLVVSTFSKDYLLVREKNHTTVIEALKELGFPVSIE